MGVKGYSKPELLAKDLLSQLNMKVPGDILIVLNELGIDYKELPLGPGVEGALIYSNENYGVVLNQNIEYESRKRFTIAHELGHYWIPEHQINEDRICLSSNVDSFDLKRNSIEYEADTFAAEFLMPKEIFMSDVQKLWPSLESIKVLADRYQTSLTATAIRFIEYTLEPCALVLMEAGKVRWNKKSKNFKFEIKTRPIDTYAEDLAKANEEFVCDSLYSHNWLADCNKEYIIEDAINFRDLGKQLALLKLDKSSNYVNKQESYEEYDYYD